MEQQYNKTQIKKIIKALEDQMSSASGKTFDKMERARRDLKNWDGTGPLPHEKTLREINVLEDSFGAESESVTEEETISEEVMQINTVAPLTGAGMPDNEETTKIIESLLEMRRANRVTNKELYNHFDALAHEIDNWKKNGRRGDIPHLSELQELGLAPKPAPAQVESAPVIVEPVVAPPARATTKVEKPVKVNEFEDVDRLVAEERLYDAIQILESETAEGADKRLRKLRAELESKTKRLADKARHTEKQQTKDFAAQKAAWRAVQEANPDNQEAREALRAVEQAEVRYIAVRQGKEALKHGEEGDRLDNLPMLNDALAEIKALLDQVKNEPSLQDLQDEINRAKDSIEKMRRDTRERLGVAATAQGQHLYGEAYKVARELLERPSPPPKIMLENGSEEDLKTFWARIRNEFVNWLRGKAAEKVTEASREAQSSPNLARNTLSEALNILNDATLTKDDSALLEVDRNHIANEIKKIDQKIAVYEEARKLVVEGQNRALPPSERLIHLKKARETFPDYPGLSTYIGNTEYDYASELARKGDEAVMQAKHLAVREIFEDALAAIEKASGAITTAFQDASKYPLLQNSLSNLDKEKEKILSQKASYEEMVNSLPKVRQFLEEYDANNNAGALKAARSLFADIQKKHSGHRLIEEMGSELIKRQGDPDNWDSGATYYNNQEWDAAEKALKQISASYQYYEHAQVLLQCSRVALLTLSGREAVIKGEWDKAINAFQRALALYEVVSMNETYAGDIALVSSFGEESRNAAETIRDNEKKSKEVVEKYEKKFKETLNAIQNRNIALTKVEPIPFFREIYNEYENSKGLTRDNLFALLAREKKAGEPEEKNGIYAVWLNTYLEGINIAIGQKVKNRVLLTKAYNLAKELSDIGLSGHESLSYQLQADLLDLDYSVMDKTSPKADLQKLEDNRDERLSVQRGWPFDENDPEQVRAHEAKIQELERSIREIMDRRMESDMLRKLNKAMEEHGSEAQGAYSDVLLQMENDPRLDGSVNGTTSTIRVAWKAHEWQKAEALARRLRENAGADYVAVSEQWLTLGKAAQAFSEDRIDDALTHCGRLPKNLDKELRAAKAEMENETLLRLLDEAKKDAALNTDVDYMEAAKKYALAYKLSPKNHAVADGLQKISARVEKTIMNLCASAESLQLRGITMDDLTTACSEANDQYAALSNFANVSAHLKLKQAQMNSLADATQHLETKSRIWDAVKAALDDFEKNLTIALNQPEKIDSRRNTDAGGWRFDALEHYLQEARKVAGRDVQLSRLIENKMADWNYKKDTAGQLNNSVIALMNAVAAEDFDQVIARSSQLEVDWKSALQDGFEGLKILVYETYPYALGKAETPLAHQVIAVRQKQNFEEWSKWVAGVKDKQNTLSKMQRELQFRPGGWGGLGEDARSNFLDQRLSIESGIGIALKEVLNQCAKGKEDTAAFQEYFQSRPASKPPVSRKAQAEADKIDQNWTDSLTEFQDYLSALDGRARQIILEIEKLLKVLDPQVQNLKTLEKKYGGVARTQLDNVRRQLEECKRKDPYNRDIDKLEETLNGFTPR